MKKLLLISSLLLPVSSFAQKIEMSTGNGVAPGPLTPTNEYPYFIAKCMYNPTNTLQVGITGVAGGPGPGRGYSWGDIFFNVYPFGIAGPGVRAYIGINGGYIMYAGVGNDYTELTGEGFKAGIHAGFTAPITSRLVFYGEGGPCRVYATTQRRSHSASHGTYVYKPEQVIDSYVPLHIGLRYRLKM